MLDNKEQRSLTYSQSIPWLVRNIYSAGALFTVLTAQNAASLSQGILKIL